MKVDKSHPPHEGDKPKESEPKREPTIKSAIHAISALGRRRVKPLSERTFEIKPPGRKD